MEISDILTPSRVAIDIAVASKKGALEELARLVASDVPALTPAQAFDGLVTRERLGSTGLGNGIAIPHGRIDHLQTMVGAFIRTHDPVEFDAIDGQPVDLFFALFVPSQANDEHLAMLSNLASMFGDDSIVGQLRNAEDISMLHDRLTKPPDPS